MSSASSVPPDILSLIDDYYKKKPNFAQHIKERKPKQETPPPESTTESKSTEPRSEEVPEVNEKIEKTPQEIRREFYFGIPAEETRRKKELAKQKKEEARTVDMPVHPKEEETQGGSITDQVAKESSDSTASDHPHHDVHDQAAKAHKGAPGPVQVNDIGKPASKEELKKRSDELNK